MIVTQKNTNRVDGPLVSIGVPTYNRPELLRTALESLINQTYRNIEIIISDNASTNPEVAKVLEEYSQLDRRVKCIVQNSNIGAAANFRFVFNVAQGDYFMWAADDDVRETWFVSEALNALERHPLAAAATAEVNYVCDGVLMPFFPQGAAYYEYKTRNALSALSFLIQNSVDNLVYSLFRRGALLQDGELFWHKTGMDSTNEIPLMLYASYSGGFVVLPKAGFIKTVSTETYQYIRWEFCGGTIPSYAKLNTAHSIKNGFIYHRLAFYEICRGLNFLPIKMIDRVKLKLRLLVKFIRHFFQMMIGKKLANQFIPREFHG